MFGEGDTHSNLEYSTYIRRSGLQKAVKPLPARNDAQELMDRNRVQSIGKRSENGTELERVEIGGQNILKIEAPMMGHFSALGFNE
jgi:hypothetical protein